MTLPRVGESRNRRGFPGRELSRVVARTASGLTPGSSPRPIGRICHFGLQQESPSRTGRGISLIGSPWVTVCEPPPESPPGPADAGRFLARRGTRPQPRKPPRGQRARCGARRRQHAGPPYRGAKVRPRRPRGGGRVGPLRRASAVCMANTPCENGTRQSSTNYRIYQTRN